MGKKDAPFYWVYRARGAVMIPLLAVILLITWREYEVESIIVPIGAAVFLAGLGVRIWAQMHLHYRLAVRKQLTTTGPYRFVRNPIYVANTLILCGLSVLSGLIWFVPIVIAYCYLAYTMVIRHEEYHLGEKYGAPYAAFLQDTPRWFPRATHRALTATDTGRFFFPSVRAELYNLLFLVIPIINEIWID